MSAFFDYPHTVTHEDIDELGHAGNFHYIKWMQHAAIAHSAAPIIITSAKNVKVLAFMLTEHLPNMSKCLVEFCIECRTTFRSKRRH